MSVFSSSVFKSTVYKTNSVVDATLRGALQDNKNRWYAYELLPQEEIKVDEFVEEFVQELKQEKLQTKAAQIDYAPVILKQISAEELIGSKVIQAAINQAVLEYQFYLAKMREREDEFALMLLLN